MLECNLKMFLNLVFYSRWKNDKLISYNRRSQKLYDTCGSRNKYIYINDNITHNDSDLMRDIIKFLKKKKKLKNKTNKFR